MITQIPQQDHNPDVAAMLQKQLQSSRYGHKVSSLNMSLIQHLQGDMLKDKLTVADSEKPFKLKNVEQAIIKADRTEMEISQLVSKRQTVENQLKKLQHEEYKLHVNQSRYAPAQSKLSQSMASSSPDRHFRSQLTEEQKAKIKSILKVQKKFIKQLRLKELEYYEEVQKDRQNKIQAEENMKKEKCQQRKVYWERIRNDIAQRQESRKKNFVEDQERLEEVKKSKKLYEVLEDSWSNQIAQDEQLIKQATQHMRQNHKFDLSKIVQHQRQYEKIAKEKQQARQRSVQEFNDRMKLTLPKIPNSKFFTTLKEEEKKKKEEDEERQWKKHELNQKRYEFSKRVKDDYKPKIDQTAKKLLLMSIEEEKIEKKPGLPLGEVQNLGNNYMRQVHKTVALAKAARNTMSKVQESKEAAKMPVKKNYLIELKQKRKAEGSSNSLTDEVSRIMKNTSYSAIEKVERTKLLARKLEGKENTKSSALIRSINQKMKILKALNED